ncbi:hypothetical protein E2C01_065928 [Portunus trituberculatus]|uniref:Uncharacterized protein n=1 Tax=Portunus trituberculatus TaxID=210409 RepID=A0A5B7HT63_PORTR|nr:hypothetical protein [Portunus trituberculatus]
MHERRRWVVTRFGDQFPRQPVKLVFLSDNPSSPATQRFFLCRAHHTLRRHYTLPRPGFFGQDLLEVTWVF